MSANAALLLRHTQSYRRDCFAEGLSRLGFRVSEQIQRSPGPRDLLVIWNRRRAIEPDVERYRAAGARILVCENGYLPGPDGKQFALALDAHNGAGRWPLGSEPRFPIPLAPWRARGSRILVLLQRGIGQQGVAMPTGWPVEIKARLAKMTDREILIRRHPGMRTEPLEPAFRDVWAAVTWGSGAGIKAIAAGVPVFHDFARWIGADAARPIRGADIEDPFIGDRGEFVRKISWAQWSIEEISTGRAFEAVLKCAA